MVWMPIRNRLSSGRSIGHPPSPRVAATALPKYALFVTYARQSGNAGGAAMDTIVKSSGSGARLLSHLPERLHHHAYVVKDHEANRRLLEDLLGIPLGATWCEKSKSRSGG